MLSEELYIWKRKLQAKALSLLFLIMRVFPIQNNKIVFAAFEGDGGFGCNPRYIAEELHKRDHGYKMVWLTHDPSRGFPEYVQAIKDKKFAMVYHLSTAKVWIDNYRKPFGTLKRKNQLYIQTWHATFGFKAVGLFRGEKFPRIARLVSEWDSNLADYFLSNSEYCDQIYPLKLLYKGPTLRTGSPRCDCIINNKSEKRYFIRKRYHLDEYTKILLYAPTFRGGTQKRKKKVELQSLTLDFERLLQAVERKFGGNWRIFLRLHPQLAAFYEDMPITMKSNRLTDVSSADDISELIAASDMLITDYSSCAFDAAFGGILVLLYADDMNEYVKNRGQFMWTRDELPFEIAKDNDEMMKIIADFDVKRYHFMVREFMNKYKVIEDGRSSERVVDLIEEKRENDEQLL